MDSQILAELNNLRIMAQNINDSVNPLLKDYDALLRMARAAEAIYDGWDNPETHKWLNPLYIELYEALKDVEHLLDDEDKR